MNHPEEFTKTTPNHIVKWVLKERQHPPIKARLGLPKRDSNIKKKSSASEFDGGVCKEDASSIYPIASQKHHTLQSPSEIKQEIVIKKALETSFSILLRSYYSINYFNYQPFFVKLK